MRTMPRIFIGLAVSLAQLITTAALAQDSYDYQRNANFAGIRTFAFKATPPMDPVAAKTTTYDSPLVRERTRQGPAAPSTWPGPSMLSTSTTTSRSSTKVGLPSSR